MSNSLPPPLEEKWQLVRPLTQGGMGQLFLARHRALDALQVIKVLRPEIAGGGDFQRRFEREAKLAASIRHPNLVTIFDFGFSHDQRPYLVLEYLEGRDFRDLLKEKAFLDLGLAGRVRVLLQAANGVAALHRAGIVHRDVSPSNLFLSVQGDNEPVVKVLDFGVAKGPAAKEEGLTQAGVLVGTPAFMAPEVFLGNEVGPAADVFSLGIVMCEVLTGERPYQAATMFEAVRHAADGTAAFAAEKLFFDAIRMGLVPGEGPLRSIVLRALDRKPERRFKDAGELSNALRDLQLTEDPERMAAFALKWSARPEERPDDTRAASAESTLVESPPPEVPDHTAAERTEAFPVEPPARAPRTRIRREGWKVGDMLADRYVVLEVAGEGRVSFVLRAWDCLDASLVAVKLFDLARGDAEDHRRFVRSGRLWRRTQHENIVRVLDASPPAYTGTPFLVLEWLDGEELEKTFSKRTPLEWKTRLGCAVQLAAAVEHLHALGVAHRDLRPGTVFFTGERQMKLLESGFAKDPTDLRDDVTALFSGGAAGGPGEPASDFDADCAALSDIVKRLLPEVSRDGRRAGAAVQALRSILARPGSAPASAREVRAAVQALGREERMEAPSRGRHERRKVVFMLHGIRTYAAWQRAFAELASTYGWNCRTSRWNFGYFSTLKFVTPWQRRAKVEWFRETYRDELADHEVELSDEDRPCIVAHSFGTYILGNALLSYDYLRFDKVILCGSILPPDFPWSTIFDRGQVRAVRNEFGTRDVWTSFAKVVVPGTGPSGSAGFTGSHELLRQELFTFSHSEYFEKAHMREKWMRFLESEVLPGSS